jgi:plastocyanin domain-containing protein
LRGEGTATSPLKQFHQHHQNEQLPLPSNNSTNIIKMNSYLSPQTGEVVVHFDDDGGIVEGRGSFSF